MAKPTYYPDWATEDTTLPSTGQANKVRPKNSLITIGWDKGQIPSAEELNWELNNFGEWIRYLNDEVVPGLADEYLPKTGTALNFTGDISGTATWNGSETTTVTLSSATLNAATSDPTPLTLTKRDSNGAVAFSQTRIVNSTNQNVYFGETLTTYRAVIGHVTSDHSFNISSLNGSASGVQQTITLYSDRVQISNPRSSSAQGSNAADLTRKDYVDSIKNTLQTNIDTVATNLSNFITTANNTYVKAIRLGTRGTMNVSGSLQDAPDGNVFVGGGDFGADDGSYAYRLLQYQINETWYTASVT